MNGSPTNQLAKLAQPRARLPSGAWPFTEWRLGRAVAEGDSDVEELLLSVVARLRGDAEQAKTRQDAALDALSASRGMAEPEETA